ncbi:hypothetical protein CCHR01_16473 [Colletotrichum chrysophilum]|uniref:Uncharacterized protein n=1 Tax=Colletotrichum chrysophilum TaxID=1836956 RepID=A0AAD9E7S0_9PEZI|nr:hypothetical protein CCHR01_16473 [Colletotrichum chrysophilum]
MFALVSAPLNHSPSPHPSPFVIIIAMRPATFLPANGDDGGIMSKLTDLMTETQLVSLAGTRIVDRSAATKCTTISSRAPTG